MMLVERFMPERHLRIVETWLTARGFSIRAGEAGFYPPTGFLVGRMVCGFVYLTNAPKVGYIDNVISDPRVPRGRRREALESLCSELLREANEKGVELLYANTSHRSLIDICKSRGFVPYGDGFTCLVRS
jgi:hypothetical protein